MGHVELEIELGTKSLYVGSNPTLSDTFNLFIN